MEQNTNINGLGEVVVEDIHFASQEFFDYMRCEINNPAGAREMYTKLAMVLKRDFYWKIAEKITAQDREDLFHDIYLDVHKGLKKFLGNPKSANSPGERYTWLSLIVSRNICDYYRSRSKTVRYNPSESEIKARLFDAEQKALDEGKTPAQIVEILKKEYEKCFEKTITEVSWENTVEGVDYENTPENKAILDDADPRISTRVKRVLNMKSDPDKRIAYIFSNIIIPPVWGDNISGKPSVAAEELCGMPLFKAFIYMKKALVGVLKKEFPESAFAALGSELRMSDRALGPGKRVGDKLFNLTSSQITVACSRIEDKLYPERVEERKAKKALKTETKTKSQQNE